MRKYPKYKSSGVAWISEIPVHWESYKMKYMVDASKYYQIGDGDHGSIKPDMYSIDGDIPYIRVQNLSWNGALIWEGMVYIPEDIHNSNLKSKIIPNDILIAKTGATIGKLAIIPDSVKEANTTSSVGKITLDSKRFDSKFILYSMMSNYFKDQIWIEAYQKSAQPGFNVDDLIFFNVVCPLSKSEQSAIANFLNEKTEQIDKLISNKQNLIELLKEERTAVINHYVLGKHLIDNGQLTMDNSQLPKHWEVKKLKYLARILSGYSPEQCKPSINNGNIPYIKVDNLNVENPNIDVAKENTTEEFIVSKKPSILFPKRGAAIALNKVAFADFSFCMDTNLMGLEIFDKSLTDVQFIYYWFKTISLISIADTSTIPQINNKHIEPLYIFLPPLKEQNQIVHLIETETKRIDDTITKIGKEIELLQEYRTALISEVVTGKIKVI